MFTELNNYKSIYYYSLGTIGGCLLRATYNIM